MIFHSALCSLSLGKNSFYYRNSVRGVAGQEEKNKEKKNCVRTFKMKEIDIIANELMEKLFPHSNTTLGRTQFL